MIAGMVPMAIGSTEGGEQTAPLGRAVIGGLMGATVATLLILPAIFAMLQGEKTRKNASIHPDDDSANPGNSRSAIGSDRSGNGAPVAGQGITTS